MHRSEPNTLRRAPWIGAAVLVLAPALLAQQGQRQIDPEERERAEEMLDEAAQEMSRDRDELEASQARLRDAVLSRLRGAAVDGELEPRRLLVTSLADGTIVAAVPVVAFGAGRDAASGRDPAGDDDSTERLGDDDGIADDAARAREEARARAGQDTGRAPAGEDPGLAQGPVIGLLLVQGSGLQARAVEAGAPKEGAGARDPMAGGATGATGTGAQRARLEDGVYTIRTGLTGTPVVTDASGRTVARVTRLGADAGGSPATGADRDPAGGQNQTPGERELENARSGLIPDERAARELEPREWFELYLALLQSLDVRHR